MEMYGKNHALATIPPEKQTEYEAWRDPESVWTPWWREDVFALPDKGPLY
jgi:hypothetical protein